ncbi:MAG: hypothetical protein E7463_02400 [Ruminococcaceae bacterium]|nr:hypothetical protein [Oscillospiraceae bacterium]
MKSNTKTACTVNVGFGTADITPNEGVHLSGGAIGVYRPAQFVRHRLYAKATIFRGEKTVCVIGLDVLLINKEYCDRIKQAVMQELGFAYEAIMVFSIQTHSAPAVGEIMMDRDFPIDLTGDREYITGTNRDYSRFVCDQAAKAARLAFNDLRPLKMDVKSGLRHGLAFCRRFIMRDGTLSMFPRHSGKLDSKGPEILYEESPMDEEVGVVCFKDEKMNIAGSMLHFTCHPVNDYCTPSRYHCVSSDWPGVWSEVLQRSLHIGQIPTVLNGCCGNVNPYNPYEPDFLMNAEMMGEALAETAERVICSMRFDGADESGVVDYAYLEIPLSYRNIPEERLRRVKELMADGKIKMDPNGGVDDEWCLAASTYSVLCCQKREPEFMYPIQVFRIGGLAIVALAGEPFTDGQLDIKLRSSAPMTYVTHCANKYVGYLPHEKAYRFNGHETNLNYTFWAKLAPGSLEKICDTAVEAIDRLF